MLFYTSLPRPSGGRKKIKTTPSIFPSAGGGTEHWKNVNAWRHDVPEWAGVFLLSAFFGASHAFIMHRLLLSSQGGWEVARSLLGRRAKRRGQVGREGGRETTTCSSRHRDGLQVRAGSICARLTHSENKSHMEKDCKLLNRSVLPTAVCRAERRINLSFLFLK